MSQEIREKALSAAIAVAGAQSEAAVIAAAAKFEAYITGAKVPAASPKAAGAPASATKATAAPAAKPAATAPAKAAAKPAAPKPEPKQSAIDPDLKKVVGDKVNELLKANLREEAVALLATFDGAQSASGIVAQGQEAVESFMAQADELLSAQPTEALAD